MLPGYLKRKRLSCIINKTITKVIVSKPYIKCHCFLALDLKQSNFKCDIIVFQTYVLFVIFTTYFSRETE